MSAALLQVEDLHLEFKTSRRMVRALNGIHFTVQPGEIFGLVGETGCGKTVTGLSVLRLLPRSARLTRGRILFAGRDLLQVPEGEMQHVRGGEIAMIFQDPTASLNPVFTLGTQMSHVVRRHLALDARQARAHIKEILAAVGLPDVERILRSYPHQLSGGMQQRAMIALALSCRPRLLIADEPTTVVDVIIQAQILALLRDLQARLQVAVILITHNLGVVAKTCDRLAVLYAGRVVEIGSTDQIFRAPQHPYTRGLMQAIPRPDRRGARMQAIPGSVPADPGAVEGCAFAPRCAYVFARCHQAEPGLIQVAAGQWSACFLPLHPDLSEPGAAPPNSTDEHRA